MTAPPDPFLAACEEDVARRSNGLLLRPYAADKAMPVPVTEAKPEPAEPSPRYASSKVIPFKAKKTECPPVQVAEKEVPKKADVKIHDFEKKSKDCSDKELKTIKAYLKHLGLKQRFRKDYSQLLRRVVHNLKRGVALEFCVGSGTGLHSNLRNDLVDAGLIKWNKSPYVDGRQGKSWMRPTQLFSEIIIRPCQLLVKEKMVKGKVVKEHVPYFPDDGTMEQLAEFNAFMEGFDVSYRHGNLNNALFRMNYVPVEGGLPLRGRLIHPLHYDVEKELRDTGEIDGVRCASRDVKACHAQIILSRDHGLAMTQDPYDIAPDGFELRYDLRGATKLMMQMMLNNGKEDSARAAFVDSDKVTQKHRRAVKMFPGRLTDFMRAIEERNPMLSDYFYKARHAELMNIDGSIMLLFHRRLMAQGIPSLSVHDEYLVRPEHLETADRVYAECWQEVTGASDVFPVVENA